MKYLKISSQLFLALMALAFIKVGVEALINPAQVLAQVDIALDTESARSSMRAVYGGMHFSFGLFCVYAMFRSYRAGLGLVALYTAGFVIGRVSSIAADGIPNEFVSSWLAVEVVSLLIAVSLYIKSMSSVIGKPGYSA